MQAFGSDRVRQGDGEQIVLSSRLSKGWTSRVEKTRLLYLVIGGIATVTSALLEALPHGPNFGNVFIIVYMYFLSQNLVRYRLLDLNELLGRMLVLGTLVFILALIYGVLVRWVAPGGDLCLVHGTSVHDAGPREDGAGAIGEMSARVIHDRFCRAPDLAVIRDRRENEPMIDLRRERSAWQGFQSQYKNIFDRMDEPVGGGQA